MNLLWFIIQTLLMYHMCSGKANWTWVSDVSLYVTKKRLFWDKRLPEKASRWDSGPSMHVHHSCQTYKNAAVNPLNWLVVISWKVWMRMPSCVSCLHCGMILCGSSVNTTTATTAHAGCYNSIDSHHSGCCNITKTGHDFFFLMKLEQPTQSWQLATIPTWRRSCSSWGLQSKLLVGTWHTSRPPSPQLPAIGLSSRSRCCGWWTRTSEPGGKGTWTPVVSC